MNPSLKTASTRGQELLDQYNAIVTAIRVAEAELPGLIQARLDSESHLATCASAAVLKEGDPKAADAAVVAMTSARARLDSTSAALKGLKTRSAGMLDTMTAARKSLEDHLPAHRESALETFAPEYNAAVRVFAASVAKRRVIEAATGGKPFEDLLELEAVVNQLLPTVDTGSLGKPGELVRDLAAVIAELHGAQQHVIRLEKRKADFNRDGVFQFIKVYHSHKLNSRTTADLIGETLCRWLYTNKYLREVNGYDLNEIRDLGRALSA